MKKKTIFSIIILTIILVLYIHNSIEVKELKSELEQVTETKEELVRIIESNTIEDNDKIIDNEIIPVTSTNMSLKEDKELYGIGIINKEVNMQSIIITNPSSEYIIQENEIVQIIDIFIDSNNKEWVLVKYNKEHVFGLIDSRYIDNVEYSGYYKESEWDINGFRIGEPLSNVINIMGYDYTVSESGEYSRDLIATFRNGDEGETRVFFDPTYMVINYISTSDKNITINGLFHVGDNVYESVTSLNKSYRDNEEDNYVIIEDSSSYYIILHYDINNEITNIIYRTYEVEA
ncbi:hypothetical protein SH1V18_38150 [Vallitalea longa]|uniref:Uncharacterized protein n=1 Tax=Vallitalea longa TaxID=2936439 RepID=A0A9W6DG77_9FIRM|nr:hypothetical protein [Vallitalea longa]GKX31335.1 hypothetical protein SH1V18_38150 [Vallitalea longa]